jgi:hypothetical protein
MVLTTNHWPLTTDHWPLTDCGIGQMAGTHVEDPLSLSAFSSFGRREYPLFPSTEFFRARSKKRASNRAGAACVRHNQNSSSFTSQSQRGRNIGNFSSKKHKSPHRCKLSPTLRESLLCRLQLVRAWLEVRQKGGRGQHTQLSKAMVELRLLSPECRRLDTEIDQPQDTVKLV